MSQKLKIMKQDLLYSSVLFLFFFQFLFVANLNGQGEKVGINTTNPQETLDVNGTIRSDTLKSEFTRIVLADSTGTLMLGDLGHELDLRDSAGNQVFGFNANSGFIIIQPPPPPGGPGPVGPAGVQVRSKTDTVVIQIKMDVEEKEIELDAEEVTLPSNVMMAPPGRLGSESGNGGGRCGVDLDPDGDRVRIHADEDTLTVSGAADGEPAGVGVTSSGGLALGGRERGSLRVADGDGHSAGLLCEAEARRVTLTTDLDSLKVESLAPTGLPGMRLSTSGSLELFGDDPMLGTSLGLSIDPSTSVMRFTGGAVELNDNLVVGGPISSSYGAVEVMGNAVVVGNLDVQGELTKGFGAFKIDHPLDPYQKDLVHSFVESPDMMNVYNGNITTDNTGYATVTLPEYFDVLNKDFRYQLTVMGEFAQAIIASEMHNNRFTIQTSKPNIKVSWQVTGIRNDPQARENRIIVEKDKPSELKGKLRYTPKTMVASGNKLNQG